MNDPSAEELSLRYEFFYPGAVVDVFDDKAIVDQTLRPEITPLRDGMTTVGAAYPVVGQSNRSVDPDENIQEVLRMLGETPEHAVVTYQTNDTDDAAHLGKLSVGALKSRAVRNAVLDGSVRGVSYDLSEDFWCFLDIGRWPMPSPDERSPSGASRRSSSASKSMWVHRRR